MANPRFSVQPQAGQQMPPNWQQQAKKRAEAADQAYLDRLQNAWKPCEINGASGNIMRDSRLKPPSWDDLLGKK